MTRIVPGPFRDAGIQQVQNAEFSAVLAAKQQSWDLGKGNRLKLPRRGCLSYDSASQWSPPSPGQARSAVHRAVEWFPLV